MPNYRPIEKEINDEQLNNEVREFPELWNKICKGYRNNRKKDAAWIRISERLHDKIEDLKARWKSIRDKYVREKKIMDGNKLSGSGASDREVWELYESLQFLKDSIGHRKTINNMSVNNGSNGNKEEVNENLPIPDNPQNEIVMETEDGDYIIQDNVLSEEDESNSLLKPGTSSSNTNGSTSSKTSTATSSKREHESDDCSIRSAKYKKPKQKADAYEQTLLKIWKENSEKLNQGCDTGREHHEDPDRLFLLSLEKDFKTLNDKNKRKAKHALLEVLEHLIEKQENDLTGQID